MPAPFLPKSLLSTSRAEFYDADGRTPEERSLPLTVKAGLTEDIVSLPDDLVGSMFIMAPAGAVDSPSADETGRSAAILPTQNGWTHLLNGDGMVYRIDFSSQAPRFSSRLMETVSFHADQISQRRYPQLKFVSYGLTRLSSYVGSCEQSNTAFLPFGSSPVGPDRLLVTWDMGRPMEIDPVTLRTIGPTGLNQAWKPMLGITANSAVLQSIMSSAHPVVLPQTSQIITVNVVKSIRGLLGLPRLLPPKWTLSFAQLSLGSFRRKLLQGAISLFQKPLDRLLARLQGRGVLLEEEVYLMRWNGDTDVAESWPVRLPNGQPVTISQTCHQMGLTQDYLIFADTAFKVTGEDVLPSILWVDGLTNFEAKVLAWLQFHRGYLNFPLLEDTPLYILRREQFDQAAPGSPLTAQKVVLKNAAIAHYLVDYNNEGGKITLHAALNQNTDFAEFIRADDRSGLGDPDVTERMQEMAGIFTDSMEVNRPVTYVIDAGTGQIEHAASLSPEDAQQYTWSMGIAAYRDLQPTEQFSDIYWTSFGAWPETLSQSVLDLYKQRSQSLRNDPEGFFEQVKAGLPTSVYRIHVNHLSDAAPQLSVADSYAFPPVGNVARFGNSPQFIPRDGAKSSIDGYLICAVNYSDRVDSQPPADTAYSWSSNTEFWVFDAQNLRQGPLYRLSHSKLNLGMTIHTAWLREIRSPANPRHYDVRQDFTAQVERAVDYYRPKKPNEAQQLAQLFEDIYAEIEQEQP